MKRRVSLIAEPIWFSFIVELLIGNGKAYFGVGYLLSLKRNRFHKKRKVSLYHKTFTYQFSEEKMKRDLLVGIGLDLLGLLIG